MKEIFADAFYFIALLSPSDNAHLRAVSFETRDKRRIATTSWVLVEVGNSLSRASTRSAFVDAWNALQVDPSVEIVGPTRDLLEKGFALYAARPDKDWSLTDCISFIVMQERGIADALTGDHHFEQAGFKALLR